MSILYQLLYLIRVLPWERDGIAPQLRELVEGPEAFPPGRALDLGCGTGAPSVYLALHGWEVTGVDVVARALAQARARAQDAGVTLHLVHGDVTRAAREVAGRGPYRLLLDAGCYHGLDEARREAHAKAVRRLAAPGAVMLLFALTPGGKTRPRSFRGASDSELKARFGQDWELVWKQPHAGPPVFGGAGQFWYLLRRWARP